MILKECEEKDGCKGEGSVQSDEKFQRSILKFVMESFKSNIFSKDMMEMHLKYN